MRNLSPVLVGGEALFDFISTEIGSGLGASKTFETRIGGSPFNIAVGVRRLGVPVSFVGKFGVDQFGEALVEFLKNESIDVTHIVREEGTKTTLAFVAVDKEGKPEFRFYRDNAADISLRSDELTELQPRGFSVFHCGGIVLAEEPSASAFASLANLFVENQIPVSLDPTVRQSLISDPDRYRSFLRRLIEKVSILKVSDEELQFLSGTKNSDVGVRALPAKAGALVFVTLGQEGASVYRDGIRLSHAPGFDVEAVETTGCGDCFMAAILAALAGNSIADLAQMGADTLRSRMRFANAAAAIVATRIGAAEANPTRQEVERFLAGDRMS
jgi:fructokinase